MQKLLLMIGPPRAGKGVITRLLRRLIGERNVCSLSLESLADKFGLAGLVGKTLATIDDARLSGWKDSTTAIVERLNGIVGEDDQRVEAKYREAYTVRLRTRFVVVSNEVPQLLDASGALAARCVFLRFSKSFLGREDRDLDRKLAGELPGILRWAIGGLADLNASEQFIQPESGREDWRVLRDNASPIGAFIRDCCRVGPDLKVTVQSLWGAWKIWSEQKGVRFGTEFTFGRLLRAAVHEQSILKRRLGRQGDRQHYYVGIKLRENDVYGY